MPNQAFITTQGLHLHDTLFRQRDKKQGGDEPHGNAVFSRKRKASTNHSGVFAWRSGPGTSGRMKILTNMFMIFEISSIQC